MKKLLCSMLALGIITCTGVLATDTQKVSNLEKPLNGSTPMMSYFKFDNLPAGNAFKITSGGNDITGYMSSNTLLYYLTLSQGTYNITLNDQLKSTACSFAINQVVVPTSRSPSGYALTMQAIHSNAGYACTLGQIGNWPNFLTIHKTN